MSRLTLDSALQQRGRPNSLNLVRLVLALLVVVSHSWPLGGFGGDPQVGGQTLGTWAVYGFFAISGFLIPASRSRLGLLAYLRARALRIFPAFWVCLIVTAFVLAPFAATVTNESWTLRSAGGYVVQNVGLWDRQVSVGTTLTGVPYPVATWNGSLWTLKYEAGAYALVGFMLFAPVRRRLRTLSLFLLVVAELARAYVTMHVSSSLVFYAAPLACYFVAGMLIYSWRSRVSVSWPVALGALLLVVVGASIGLLDVLGPLGWSYLVLYAGAVVPARWAQHNDISYGVYIYGFPVLQLLAVLGVQAHGVVAMAVAGCLITSTVAWVSWLFIERRALMLKPAPGRRRSEDDVPGLLLRPVRG